jgi:hypothetical protein
VIATDEESHFGGNKISVKNGLSHLSDGLYLNTFIA